MEAASMEVLVGSIAAGLGTDSSEQAERVEAFVRALRSRFAERSRGSLFHTLKTELSAAFVALEPPGTAHAAVATILSSGAMGAWGESSGGAVPSAGGGSGEDGEAAPVATSPEPEPEPEGKGAKAGATCQSAPRAAAIAGICRSGGNTARADPARSSAAAEPLAHRRWHAHTDRARRCAVRAAAAARRV